MISFVCFILCTFAALVLFGVELSPLMRDVRNQKASGSPRNGRESRDSVAEDGFSHSNGDAPVSYQLRLRLISLTIIVVAGIGGMVSELQRNTTHFSFPGTPKLSKLCAEWLLQHLIDLPMRQEDFGTNVRFLAAAKDMFERNRNIFPLETRLRLENLLQTETQLRQLPSIGEQARIYRTAQEVFIILRDLAGMPSSKD